MSQSIVFCCYCCFLLHMPLKDQNDPYWITKVAENKTIFPPLSILVYFFAVVTFSLLVTLYRSAPVLKHHLENVKCCHPSRFMGEPIFDRDGEGKYRHLYSEVAILSATCPPHPGQKLVRPRRETASLNVLGDPWLLNWVNSHFRVSQDQFYPEIGCQSPSGSSSRL